MGYNDEMIAITKTEIINLIRNEIAGFGETLRKAIAEIQKDANLSERIMNIQEVADRYHVSKQTVHTWMNAGLIKGFKQGKGRFFYLHELDKSLTRYKHYEALKKSGDMERR